MAYPVTSDTFQSPIPGTTLTNAVGADHGAEHNLLGSAVGTIERVVGTTAGTNVLKNFAAGDFPSRINSSGTLQQILIGTINNSTFGTPAIVGGTVNNTVLGTPAITGGTVTNTTVANPNVRSWQGWQDANETWTYASATTLTVPSDATLKYSVGDAIFFTQSSTVKYFYIVGVTATVLTVTGGSDYTLTNNAITTNFYSHAMTPVGFPCIFNYITTPTGWAATPSVTTAKFTINGNMCTVWLDVSGTSNDVTIVLTAPIMSIADFFDIWAYALDNGSGLTTPGSIQIVSGTKTINIFKQTSNSSSWTNTGTKRVIFQLSYLI